MRKTIEVGDRVKYSALFCRNTGQYTGSTPFARGEVTDLVKLGTTDEAMVMAVVNWTNDYAGEVPTKVNAANLRRESDPETEAR